MNKSALTLLVAIASGTVCTAALATETTPTNKTAVVATSSENKAAVDNNKAKPAANHKEGKEQKGNETAAKTTAPAASNEVKK
ncbi:MAG: hypothetical protein HQM06_03540 [Magnetococcales bacterium]|nr:hypothetical protein [Magnetococcales bacterium]